MEGRSRQLTGSEQMITTRREMLGDDGSEWIEEYYITRVYTVKAGEEYVQRESQSKVCEVRKARRGLNRLPTVTTINWSAIGAVKPKVAEEFHNALGMAITLARHGG